jgi:hypothetical protein
MKYSKEEFETLVEQFNSCGLPKASWTHEAHILVAFWHVSKYDEAEALIRVRQAIRDYNTAVGTVNGDTSGYHETLTVFWLKIVRHFFKEKEFRSVVDAANAFVEAGKADKTLPLQFYSNERLFSVEARNNWIEPDRHSLAQFELMTKAT